MLTYKLKLPDGLQIGLSTIFGTLSKEEKEIISQLRFIKTIEGGIYCSDDSAIIDYEAVIAQCDKMIESYGGKFKGRLGSCLKKTQENFYKRLIEY